MTASRTTVPTTATITTAVSLAVALVLGLSACTPDDPAPETAASTTPSATSSTTSSAAPPSAASSATPGAAGSTPQAADEATLQAERAARLERVESWAEPLLPSPPGVTVHTRAYSYSDAGLQPVPYSVALASLEPGGYSVQLACRGDGSVVFTGTSGDTEVLKIARDCDGGAQGITVTVPVTGATFTVLATGDTDYGFMVADVPIGS